MYDHTFSKLANHQIRPHMKWAVRLVIAYGHFDLPQGFVWVCLGQHTHFITPKGDILKGNKGKKNNSVKGTKCALGDDVLCVV